MKIKKIDAYEILDSRGNPTIETKITLENDMIAKASVPSGASTGTKEKLELRDEEDNRFHGKGVQKAIGNVKEKIFPAIKEIDVENQKEIDEKMLEIDDTENKSNLGANAILSVSLAICRAAAKSKNIPLWQYIQEFYDFGFKDDYQLPVPMMNVINGGAHADSGLDIQEFMLVPAGIDNFFDRVRAGSEIYHYLKEVLKEKGQRIAVGDEGGFAPKLKSNEEALEVIKKAIENSSYNLGQEVSTGIDAAGSEFFEEKERQYNLRLDKASINSKQLGNIYKSWVEKFDLKVIEDPMSEFDWEGWTEFQAGVDEEVTVIGDDLLVTNKELVKEAIEKKACNGVLIKVNQIGSLSETIETIKLAQKAEMKIAVSHRSGETTDDFIADLAVAVSADFVKFGAPARGERVSKYNRIIEIERMMKR